MRWAEITVLVGCAWFAPLACSSGGSVGAGDAAIASGGATFGGGGSAGTGGSLASGGGNSTSPGKVSIEISVQGPETYCTESQCGEAPPLVFRDARGNPLKLSLSCSEVGCDTCAPSACPGYACQPMGLGVSGATLEWDGSIYAPATCGGGKSCIAPTFAAAGRYTVTYCATPGTLASPDGGVPHCTSTGSSRCVSIDFDFPAAGTVKGTVGP